MQESSLPAIFMEVSTLIPKLCLFMTPSHFLNYMFYMLMISFICSLFEINDSSSRLVLFFASLSYSFCSWMTPSFAASSFFISLYLLKHSFFCCTMSSYFSLLTPL